MAPQRPGSLPNIHVPPIESVTASNTYTNGGLSTPQSSIYSEIKSTLALPDTTIAPKSPRLEQPQILTTDFYLDREGKYTADMLTRFRNLVMLANSQKSADDNGSKASREVAASEALAMEVETRALVRAAEDLLQLTREMKELWLFGPLREIGEGEGEGKMDEDSVKVGEMVEQILRKDAESSKSKLAG